VGVTIVVTVKASTAAGDQSTSFNLTVWDIVFRDGFESAETVPKTVPGSVFAPRQERATATASARNSCKGTRHRLCSPRRA
jgi:hypothetical protein